MTAKEMRMWNHRNPTKKQFTKLEHSNSKGICADEIWFWNKSVPEEEQYSKLEHSKSKNISADEMRFWNHYIPDAEQYSKSEHFNSIKISPKEMQEWNNCNRIIPNEKKYSQQEIDDIELIRRHPGKITEEIFNKYKNQINNIHSFKFDNFKSFHKFMKSKNI